MGCAMSTRSAELCAELRVLRARVLALEEETGEARRRREREARAHERRLAALAWRHGQVVYSLEKRLQEEEERMRTLEMAATGGDGANEELRRLGAWRHADLAAERWKQLYLAIKAELDALILRTKQCERLCRDSGKDVIGRLRRELKAKEELVEALRSRLEVTEKEVVKRDGEIDILRQSLRILSSKKRRNRATKSIARILCS